MSKAETELRETMEAHFTAKYETAKAAHAEADLRYKNAKVNGMLPTKGRTNDDLRAAWEEWQAAEKAWFASLAVLNAAIDDCNLINAYLSASLEESEA